ncbi:hypothetical protein IT403_01000 [Candidatus Nomurabacteria bacterium]|nr:hypothetical protein [Candidatus Nomurabacteria bacterium]
MKEKGIVGPKCIETQNGNFLVCFPFTQDDKQTTFYFFMDKTGKPLNGAVVNIWSQAKQSWRKPILPLPEDVTEKAKIIASKLHSLKEKGLLSSATELVFGKETETTGNIKQPHKNKQLAAGLKKVFSKSN